MFIYQFILSTEMENQIIVTQFIFGSCCYQEVPYHIVLFRLKFSTSYFWPVVFTLFVG